MKTSVIYLAAFVLFGFGCKNPAGESDNGPTTDSVVHKEHHHHSETDDIELNNGEKWKMDSSMFRFIGNMESTTNSFNGKELDDYKVLSETLQLNIDSLTANCTMKGDAHDALHKWLLPFIENVDALAEAESLNEASQQLTTIQTAFITFHRYFE